MMTAVQTRISNIFDATVGRLWITRIWDSLDREVHSNGRALTRPDILLSLMLGACGIAVSIWAFFQTGRVPELHTMTELWLQADVPRAAENMVTTAGNHGRTSVHPIYSILLYPVGRLLMALGAEPLLAAKMVTVFVMGANVTLFSLTTRLLGLPQFAMALFSVLFMATASFMFWSGVVESYPFSCLSVLIALFLMFRVKTAHGAWWMLANVLTLGFLVTNWLFALIAMAVRLKMKPFLTIGAASFAFVAVLSVVQNQTFEKAAIFFNPEPLLRESQFLQPAMQADGAYEEGWRPSANLRSMYVTTVVAMPAYAQQQRFMRVTTSNQNSGFPPGEISPVIAVIAWVVLLGAGVWGAVSRRECRLPLLGAGLMLTAQTMLHLVYGEVTFLYSLSFMPLILLLASQAWFAPYRKVGIAMAGIVIVFGGINNERRLQEQVEIADCLSELDTVQRLQKWELAKDEIVIRPEDEAELQVNTHDLCGTISPSRPES